MRCSSCGAAVVPEAVFCHRCGWRIEATENTSASFAKETDSASAGGGEKSASSAGSNGYNVADAIRAAAAERQPAEPEQELWRGGYSGKAMLGGWVLSGLIDVVLLVFGIYWGFSAKGWLILLLLMALPWLYHAVLLGYRRLGVRYVLTTQCFLHETGILWRVTNCIETIDIDDITFSQGPLERLMGVGTIRIVSSDRSHPELLLPGIAEVKDVANKFDTIRRTERRRHSLHLEQI